MNYKLKAADSGYFILAKVTNAAGSSTSHLIGPILSPTAGALKITGASATLKSKKGTALLSIKRTVTKPKPKAKVKTSSYKLALTRAAKLKGKLSVWACLLKSGDLVSCTRAVSLTGKATLSESVASGETVELIAVL
jgi:hypothetical protein